MKKRDIRKLLLKFLRENARGYVISDILKQDLEVFKSAYMMRNKAEVPPELEAHFMEWKKGNAALEADNLILSCVDEFMASKFKWLPFRNIAITGVLVAPATVALIMYAIKHFYYLMGNEEAFTNLSYEGLAGTVFAILGLSVVLLASCIDELRKE